MKPHHKYDRITIDPNRCFGKPCIRDLRLPVTSLLSYPASGMTVEEILEEWPELELEDIYQALGYAAWAMTERVLPLEGLNSQLETQNSKLETFTRRNNKQ